MMRRFAAIPLIVAASACAPIQVVTGPARDPILESDVVVYAAAPSHFEQIALLSATTKTLFHAGGQKSIDKLVKRFAVRAAKLGANGIILDEFSDEQSMSLGTGLGSDKYTHNADISLGLGGVFGVYKTTGNVRAIYVPPAG
jgi:hypothetical protein